MTFFCLWPDIWSLKSFMSWANFSFIGRCLPRGVSRAAEGENQTSAPEQLSDSQKNFWQVWDWSIPQSWIVFQTVYGRRKMKGVKSKWGNSLRSELTSHSLCHAVHACESSGSSASDLWALASRLEQIQKSNQSIILKALRQVCLLATVLIR